MCEGGEGGGPFPGACPGSRSPGEGDFIKSKQKGKGAFSYSPQHPWSLHGSLTLIRHLQPHPTSLSKVGEAIWGNGTGTSQKSAVVLESDGDKLNPGLAAP